MPITLKDTPLFTDLNFTQIDRELVCGAINIFSTTQRPPVRVTTLGDFPASEALAMLECAQTGSQLASRRDHLRRIHEGILKLVTDEEGADADFYNETITAAEEAFWSAVATRYRTKGVTTGDFDPASTRDFREACTNAIAMWLQFNKPRRPQTSDSASQDDGDRDEDSRDAWDPDRNFHERVRVAAEAGFIQAGWTVTYEYPGYFCFRHKARPDFQIVATPDHEKDGFVSVDAHDDDGDSYERFQREIEWDLVNRDETRATAVAFLGLVNTVLAEAGPKKLVVEYDVTGLSDEQIDDLSIDASNAADADMGGGVKRPAVTVHTKIVTKEAE